MDGGGIVSFRGVFFFCVCVCCTIYPNIESIKGIKYNEIFMVQRSKVDLNTLPWADSELEFEKAA